jgi:glycosyltransferase involved in cell wall biosynthesis
VQPPEKCVAVIPCLNEAANIFTLVETLRRQINDVIVVDDGSRDDTAALAARAGAEVIRHDQPRGKGASLKAGWQRAAERGFSWALCLDGDGQHSVEDVPLFLAAIRAGSADLIVGNRFANPGKMPWLRRQVNQWMSRRLARVAGIALPDSQCGFRMMRLSAWAKVPLESQHFEIESEMLLAFVAGGCSIQFVPVRTIYADERSKVNPLRDTVRWLRWWRAAQTKISNRK